MRRVGLALGMLLFACSAGGAEGAAGEDEQGGQDEGEGSVDGTDTAGTGMGETDSDGTDSDGETEGEEGADFLGPSDLIDDEAVLCDVWDPDGPCEADEKCQWGAGFGGGCTCGTGGHLSQCVVAGAAQIGEPCCAPLAGQACEGSAGPNGVGDSCAAGARCHFLGSGGNEGVCVEYCTGSPDEPSCPVSGNDCRLIDAPGWEAPMPLCPDVCDPLDPAACLDGELCGPSRESGALDLFHCVPATAPLGYAESCDVLAPDACDAGLLCVQASTVGADCSLGGDCCAALCDLLEPDSCPGADQVCTPLFEADDPAYAGLGACLEA